jgi:cyanophycinase
MLARIFLFFSVVFAVCSAVAVKRSNYQIWCVGKCSIDAKPTSTEPGAVLMGGGKDTDEAFMWQSQNANGGDFVVLRASGDDAYNEYIMGMSAASGKPLNSVTTILFNNARASEEPEVLSLIQNAEAIFFAGGNQADYMNYFVGTSVQQIIQDKLVNTTVGGTSAGLAILGNWIYTAETGSIESDDALANPYDREIMIAPAFLKIPFMDTLITDTHFVTRNRMGRMLTFLARDLQDDASLTMSRAVGVDEHTALLLNVTSGDVSTVGVGTAYVCTSNHDPEVCADRTPLTFHNIACTRLSGKANDAYSFATFTAAKGSGVDYVNSITNGQLTDFPYGPTDE